MQQNQVDRGSLIDGLKDLRLLLLSATIDGLEKKRRRDGEVHA